MNQLKILTCFASWIEFTNSIIIIEKLAQHSCTFLSFRALCSLDLCEKASECLCLIINKFHGPIDSHSQNLHKLITEQIFESLIK